MQPFDIIHLWSHLALDFCWEIFYHSFDFSASDWSVRNFYFFLVQPWKVELFQEFVHFFQVVCFIGISIQFSCSVMSNFLWPHGLQHSRLPCPSPTPGAYSNSCPLRQWHHPNISSSSSVTPFSSHLQSFPASGSFPMSRFFASGGQSIGVSALASVFPMNIQDWFPLGWTGWISLQSKGLSRVFSNTTVQKRHFFSTQLSL